MAKQQLLELIRQVTHAWNTLRQHHRGEEPDLHEHQQKQMSSPMSVFAACTDASRSSPLASFREMPHQNILPTVIEQPPG